MCHTDKGFTEETLETASKLVAQLLTEHDLTINDVYRHLTSRVKSVLCFCRR